MKSIHTVRFSIWIFFIKLFRIRKYDELIAQYEKMKKSGKTAKLEINNVIHRLEGMTDEHKRMRAAMQDHGKYAVSEFGKRFELQHQILQRIKDQLDLISHRQDSIDKLLEKLLEAIALLQQEVTLMKPSSEVLVKMLDLMNQIHEHLKDNRTCK